MKQIKDFAVSSQEAGFDKFLKVYNEYFKFDFFGNAKFYGAKNGENYQTGQAWITPIIPSEAIALLTGKQLTEGEKPTIENACFYHDGSDEAKELYRACCKMLGFEKESDGYEGSFTIVNNTQKCIEGLTIVKHGYVQVSISDYFKLLPTQESVKERNGDPSMDEMIQLVEQLESDKFHLQQQLKELQENAEMDSLTIHSLRTQLSGSFKECNFKTEQLKEAKELITQIDFHLNYYGQIDKDTQIQINQFLTRNQ